MAVGGFTTSDYLSVASAPATTAPLTFAAWVKFSSLGAVQTFLSMCNSADTTNSFSIGVNASSKPVCRAGDSGGLAIATGATTLSTGTWYHLAGLENGSDRAIYLNGASDGTNATLRVPLGINQTVVGARGGSTILNALTGVLAEAAVWSVLLGAAELAALAAGYSPLLVRPASLVAYWPLVRLANVNNRLAGHNLGVTGAPTDADHCRVLSPPPQRLVSLETGVGRLLSDHRNLVVGRGLAA